MTGENCRSFILENIESIRSGNFKHKKAYLYVIAVKLLAKVFQRYSKCLDYLCGLISSLAITNPTLRLSFIKLSSYE